MDKRVAPEVMGELDTYWTGAMPRVWVAYKAYARGQYCIFIIDKVRKDNRLALEDVERQALHLEASYVTNRDAGTYAAL